MNIKLENVLKNIEELPFQNILPQVNEIKALLAKGCDVDGQDANGDTLLHVLVKSGQFKGHNTIESGDNKNPRPYNVLDINYLLQYRPNPFIENKQGLTPAMLAANKKETTAWQLLTAYEQKYAAEHTAEVLNGLFVLAEMSLDKQDVKSKKISAARKNITMSILKLRGNQKRQK